MIKYQEDGDASKAEIVSSFTEKQDKHKECTNGRKEDKYVLNCIDYVRHIKDFEKAKK